MNVLPSKYAASGEGDVASTDLDEPSTRVAPRELIQQMARWARGRLGGGAPRRTGQIPTPVRMCLNDHYAAETVTSLR